MSLHVHAIRNGGRAFRYRVWNKISNAYATTEVNSRQVRDYLKEREEGLTEEDISNRLVRARERGTSELGAPRRGIDAWEEK